MPADAHGRSGRLERGGDARAGTPVGERLETAAEATFGPTLTIRLILVGIPLLLSLLFFLQNQDHEARFRYFSFFHFGMQEASTPIYKPILTASALAHRMA